MGKPRQHSVDFCSFLKGVLH